MEKITKEELINKLGGIPLSDDELEMVSGGREIDSPTVSTPEPIDNEPPAVDLTAKCVYDCSNSGWTWAHCLEICCGMQ